MLKYLVYYFYKILTSLWRMHVTLHPETEKKVNENVPLILAHWHGDELALIHLVKRFRLATMTSTSKDGELVDFVIRKLGGDTSRGSSTRGGVSALKGLIRLCRSGRIVSVAVDGPRGPIYQPKPGVFELSRLCDAEIIPVGVMARPVYVFKKSWNLAFLPLPFSRVSVHFDKPLPAIKSEDNPKDFALSQALTGHLFSARQQASKNIAAL